MMQGMDHNHTPSGKAAIDTKALKPGMTILAGYDQLLRVDAIDRGTMTAYCSSDGAHELQGIKVSLGDTTTVTEPKPKQFSLAYFVRGEWHRTLVYGSPVTVALAAEGQILAGRHSAIIPLGGDLPTTKPEGMPSLHRINQARATIADLATYLANNPEAR